MSNEGRQANKRWYCTGHSFTRKCSWLLGPTVVIVSRMKLLHLGTDFYWGALYFLASSILSLWSKLTPKELWLLCAWPLWAACAEAGVSLGLFGPAPCAGGVVTPALLGAVESTWKPGPRPLGRQSLSVTTGDKASASTADWQESLGTNCSSLNPDKWLRSRRRVA